ncbi:hypothetical protein [Bradyrhizobium sp. Ec3.3]|uniref:hypothetical protein n=1 Tax=Bradyrhizobium sp. Ec3.3 TaxID=189753 RepID=UPI0004864279|nr:hypothetical protein [Bradyrhizobium sp. Ec3.3]
MRGSFFRAFLVGLSLTALMICGLGIGAAWLLVPTPAVRFATAAFSFEMPAGWSCTREVTEYVCRLSEPSDAIVIMTMKYRSADDTLVKYEEHLRTPMPAVGRDGHAELVSVGRRTIAGSEWVEGILRDSEAHNYDTTYLTGITAEVAILFTLSVHAKYREARAKDLRKMIESLVVYQRPH